MDPHAPSGDRIAEQLEGVGSHFGGAAALAVRLVVALESIADAAQRIAKHMGA